MKEKTARNLSPLLLRQAESLKLSRNSLIALAGLFNSILISLREYFCSQFAVFCPQRTECSRPSYHPPPFLSISCVFDFSSFCLASVRPHSSRRMMQYGRRAFSSFFVFIFFYFDLDRQAFPANAAHIRRLDRPLLVNHGYSLDSLKPPPRFQFICYKVDSAR